MSSCSFKPAFAPASTFTGFEKFGSAFNPAEVAAFGGVPSTFGGNYGTWSGVPSTLTGCPTTFGGFPTNFTGYNALPSTFGGNFGAWSGVPSTFGGCPTTFGGFPSTWGYPTNFGGFEAKPWTNYGGLTGFNTPTGLFTELAKLEKVFDKEVERDLYTIGKMFELANKYESNKTGTGKSFTSTMSQLPSRPTSSIEYFTFQNPIRFDAQGNRNLYLCFDLPSFKPEEVTVTLYSKANPAYIEVLASHDVKESPKEHAVKRTYERKYFFPAELALAAADIAKLELKSYFTPEGVLCVEAALPRLTPEQMITLNKSHRCLPAFSAPVKTEKKDI